MRIHAILTPLLFLGNPAITAEANLKPLPSNPITPVADLLAKGEGNWDSVNRGRAGDTPGGIKSITGKSFSEHTVGEVRSMQRRSIYAVGRYQFIPNTFSYAVRAAGVRPGEHFTPEVQNRLLKALLDHKRPSIGAYIRGEHANLNRALTALSQEWASVAWRNGRSYYAGRGGNAAHVTRHEAAIALNRARELHLARTTE